jgi:hypothetical protein
MKLLTSVFPARGLRPIPCPEQPIRFTARDGPDGSGCTFRLDPGQGAAPAPPQRHRVQRLCSTLFHPTVPFVILYVQTIMQPSVVKFYFR